MKSKINFLKQKSYNSENKKKITDNKGVKKELGLKLKRPSSRSKPSFRKRGPMFSGGKGMMSTELHRKYLREKCFKNTNSGDIGKKLNDIKKLRHKIL